MKATIVKITKPNPDKSYTVEYAILTDEGETYLDNLEVRVEQGQSAKSLVAAELSKYEEVLSTVDVEVGEEI